MVRLILLGWVLLPFAAAARPSPAVSIPAPSALCRAAILQAERGTRVPDRLLDAIAVVESGKRDPVSGAVYPWPWTINAQGVGHWYGTKEEAVAAAKDLQAQGIRSMDVGCMQVNLMHHPDAFASLDQAFDPAANAAYAARFLTQLFNQTNAWPLAAGAYHSFTPDLGAEYARKVLAAWGVPQLPVAAQAVIAQALTGQAPDGRSLSVQSVPAHVSAASAAPVVSGGGGGGRVAVLLPPAGGEAIRVLPLPGGAAAPVTAGIGRGLDAYRAAPIYLSSRMPRAG